MGIYDSSPELRTGTSQYKILHDWYRLDKNPHTFKFPEHIRPGTIDVFRARYDEFIRYCDNQFEKLVTELSKRDIFKDTVVIVSADHGDIFRPPFLTHGNSLYEPETHIPLIIKEPGQTEGKVVDDLIEQIDVPATILDFAKIPLPPWMEGRSITPLLQGMELPSRTAFSMGLQFNPSRASDKITRADIAAWEGDYKLIYNLERKESLLFNLRQDPGELNNLREKEPEISRHLLQLINENLEKANERIGRNR
jgi:arylsulfatase A-like enzyme